MSKPSVSYRTQQTYRIIHIPCAAGGNVQTDLAVMRIGDLVRIICPSKVDIIPSDAAFMARTLLAFAVSCGWHDPYNDLGDEVVRLRATVAKLQSELDDALDLNEAEIGDGK